MMFRMLHTVSFSMLLLLLSTTTTVDGFLLTPQSKPIESLVDIAQAQSGLTVTARLEVGEKEDERIFLDKLELELLSDTMSPTSHDNVVDEKKKKKKTVGRLKMPGYNGPHPKTSSGIYNASVKSLPSFIGMNGLTHMKIDDDCRWELVWRDNAPSGMLICGMNVPEAVQRNNAVLNPGRLYLSIPVWKPETIAAQRAKKREVGIKAQEFLKKKEEELRLMHETTNVLKQLYHYRNAALAMESYSYTGYATRFRNIPDENDNDLAMVPIAGGLLMSKKGGVWSMTNEKHWEKKLVGYLYIKSHEMKDDTTTMEEESELHFNAKNTKKPLSVF